MVKVALEEFTGYVFIYMRGDWMLSLDIVCFIHLCVYLNA
jgi:hypothetical protein